MKAGLHRYVAPSRVLEHYREGRKHGIVTQGLSNGMAVCADLPCHNTFNAVCKGGHNLYVPNLYSRTRNLVRIAHVERLWRFSHPRVVKATARPCPFRTCFPQKKAQVVRCASPRQTNCLTLHHSPSTSYDLLFYTSTSQPWNINTVCSNA